MCAEQRASGAVTREVTRLSRSFYVGSFSVSTLLPSIRTGAALRPSWHGAAGATVASRVPAPLLPLPMVTSRLDHDDASSSLPLP